MATAFPFNLLPKLPGRVISQLAPAIADLQSKLLSLSNDLSNKVSSLPNSVKCDDPRVTDIKTTLSNLQSLIQSAQQLTTFIPQVASVFNTLATVGQVISTIQLVIPAVSGFPQGPIVQTLSAAAELSNNAASAAKNANNSIAGFSPTFDRINSVINRTTSKLTALCGVSPDSGGGLGGGTLQDIIQQNDTNLNDLYPSNFYNTLNVSDTDIQQRISAIQNLLDEGLSVIENLNEAPSGVILSAVPPTNANGQQGDYYINTTTQTIYGPKTDAGWNTGINY